MEDPAVTEYIPSTAVGSVVEEALALDWGDWTSADIDRIVNEQPYWAIRRVYGNGPMIDLRRWDTRMLVEAHEMGGHTYRWAEIPALSFPHATPGQRRDALARFVDAAAVNGGVVYSGAGGPHARWHSDTHTVVLQGNDRSARIRVYPSAIRRPGHRLIAAAAALLHDRGDRRIEPADIHRLAAEVGGRVDGSDSTIRVTVGREPPLRFNGANLDTVHVAGYEGTLAERRAVFAELAAVVIGRVGEPTVFGGRASGPQLRWRFHDRQLVMEADRRHGVTLRLADTERMEAGERHAFEERGPWVATEPSDFRHLPYLWLWERGGPGESRRTWPDGRLALGMRHLAEALTLVLNAWIEQLPAQIHGESARFDLRIPTQDNRTLTVMFCRDRGVRVAVDDRDGEDSPARATAMRRRGWQERHAGWWHADFDPHREASARDAVALILSDLADRGVRDPREHLRLKDVNCADHGRFMVPGLGLGV